MKPNTADPEDPMARIAADAANMAPDKTIADEKTAQAPRRKTGANRDLRDLDDASETQK
jgi:hypothetical protein